MKLMFTFSLLFSVFTSWAQINKGQFLVGGSGTFYANSYSMSESKNRGFYIEGRSGIFLIDKMAAGVQLGYSYVKEFYTLNTGERHQQFSRDFSTGPFLRYYILAAEKKINFLVDGSYYHKWSKSGVLRSSVEKSYGYAFGAGPAFFLNPNISLETTLNYEYNDELRDSKKFKFKVGFQAHLTKRKTSPKQGIND